VRKAGLSDLLPECVVDSLLERHRTSLGQRGVRYVRERYIGADRSPSPGFAQLLRRAAKPSGSSGVAGGRQAGEAVETVGDAAAVAQRRERPKCVSEAAAGAGLVPRPAGRLAEDLQTGGVVERSLVEIGERREGMGLRREGMGLRRAQITDPERRFGQAARSSESSDAAAITCSRLSRRTSSSRTPMCSASPFLAPTDFEMASGTRPGSCSAASSTQKTPAS
jgi:hypothetical protein